ncbi:hypothetical protein [Pseudanabaena sp. 'Roaring Creek']|uniref:hypothetical protein n=1 Tax=Pseudanabaena sp. 'Roaring Creek' TaxID=1681830 RepID=UPI0006D7ED41|nr:hypothetical protein [Pseudanabaena sp. 'Roaring Creek']
MGARVIYEGSGAGSVKVGFYSQENRYKSVASALGLKKVKSASEGVNPAKGASGVLPKLRANLENGKSVVLYFAPDKAASVLKGVKGKNVNGSKVRTASFLR